MCVSCMAMRLTRYCLDPRLAQGERSHHMSKLSKFQAGHVVSPRQTGHDHHMLVTMEHVRVHDKSTQHGHLPPRFHWFQAEHALKPSTAIRWCKHTASHHMLFVAISNLSMSHQKQLMQEHLETFAAGIKETLCAKLDGMAVQLETLQRRVDSSQKTNEELSLNLAASTAKVNELQAQVHGSEGTSGGKQAAEMQAVLVQAAVTATADAAEMEQKKLNLRLNRLPETVKSQVDAEAMVPELMEALQVDVEVSKVTYLKPAAKPSYNAALTASSAPSARTGAVLVSVKSVQAKLEILKARKHLRDSPVFASVGVEEDLTKRQQELKNASWPAFVAARKAGKKAFWIAEKLVIPDSRPPPATSAVPAYSQRWD